MVPGSNPTDDGNRRPYVHNLDATALICGDSRLSVCLSACVSRDPFDFVTDNLTAVSTPVIHINTGSERVKNCDGPPM
jgi:hypothetical protein